MDAAKAGVLRLRPSASENGKDLRERPLLERRDSLKELLPSEIRFCSARSSPETLLHSLESALIISLRASFPSLPHQNIAADAARPGLRQNALLKGHC
jgi:hypothetical protein